MEIRERLKSGWDIWIWNSIYIARCLRGFVWFSFYFLWFKFWFLFCYSKQRYEVSGNVHVEPTDSPQHTSTILLFLFPVCVRRRLEWLHRPSGWASVMPLRADSSHQSYLPASIPAPTVHCQAPGYRVPASAKCPTVHGLRQGSSLWVHKNEGHCGAVGENLASLL